MDLTSDIFTTILSPLAAFLPDPDNPSTSPMNKQPNLPPRDNDPTTTTLTPWQISPLNPQSRLDSLDPIIPPPTNHLATVTKENGYVSRYVQPWQIDGVNATGRRFFAVPHFTLQRPPLRVDVYIPPVEDFPPSLREVLRPEKAIWGSESALGVGGLAIGRWLGRVLWLWEGQQRETGGMEGGGGLEEAWWKLPFGSVVMVNFEGLPGGGGGDGGSGYLAREKVSVSLVPRYGVEQGMLSVEKLRKIWEGEVSDEAWEAVDIVDWERLRFRRQVHDVISLVTLDAEGAERDWGQKSGTSKEVVFKCVLQEQRYMYNELKMLLLLERHPNVNSRVIGVVTKKGRFGNKRGVCGFLLEWFPLGSLRGMLLRDDYHERVSVPQKLKWATQITGALIHVNNLEHAGFYPDLKPDNIVLKRDSNSGMLDAVLIDLEQRGGWFSWSPPEVTYLEYLEILVSDSGLPDGEIKNRITEQLREYYNDPEWLPEPSNQLYHNTQGGFGSPWQALLKERNHPNVQSRRLEQAQVFMLGKLLWSIFEGQPRVRCGIDHELLQDSSPHYDAERTRRAKAFPEFKHTPPSLQQLIQECTAGAQQWESEAMTLSPAVLLRDGKLYAGDFCSGLGTHAKDNTVTAAREFWAPQVERAQEFLQGLLLLENRTRGGRDNISESLVPRATLDLLGQTERRPQFQHILETLGRIEKRP